MVITQHGIVASKQTLASQAGAAILARGGNAVLRNFKTKVNYGGSDPRKDGAAIPEANVK